MEVTMTRIIGTTSKRRLSAKLATGLAIAAILAVGTFAGSANADWRNDHRGYHNWNGGYYRAPPVVYGSAYNNGYYGSPYYAPPVVYGPSIGISLPGVNIGIR
jgi:hypothetical protein